MSVTGAPDHQRAGVSPQQLLGTLAGGGSADFDLPANTETLLIHSPGASVGTLTSVVGTTTGTYYPFTALPIAAGSSAGAVYAVTVIPVVDPTVTVTAAGGSDAWYVVANASPRLGAGGGAGIFPQYTGTVPPDGAQVAANVGDWYLDTTTGALYVFQGTPGTNIGWAQMAGYDAVSVTFALRDPHGQGWYAYVGTNGQAGASGGGIGLIENVGGGILLDEYNGGSITLREAGGGGIDLSEAGGGGIALRETGGGGISLTEDSGGIGLQEGGGGITIQTTGQLALIGVLPTTPGAPGPAQLWNNGGTVSYG
jgi:hypothetical protein